MDAKTVKDSTGGDIHEEVPMAEDEEPEIGLGMNWNAIEAARQRVAPQSTRRSDHPISEGDLEAGGIGRM